MVPNVAGTGTSFRGAALYYLHDKRQEGETERLTTERVAWSETRNLATDDPELAWRIMAATALDSDRLKAAAGVRNTGRKSDASVYAYSIAWHPDEKAGLSRAEMVRAAEESILALGAQDRQAIIIAHRDEPHPHVHVLLNRVSSRDGRMLGTSNDYRKLDAWALAYRQARGEEHKYCPARADKAAAARKTSEGLKADFVRGAKNVPRSMAADFAAAKTAANDNDARRELARQAALSKKLAADSQAQRTRHRLEWSELSAGYKAKKAKVFAEAKAARDRAGSQVKEQFKPAWRDLFRRQWTEERDFKNRESRLLGKINNALDAVAHRRELDPVNSRGFVASAFNFLTSAKAREEAFKKRQILEQRRLAAVQRREFEAAKKRIGDNRSGSLKDALRAFTDSRAGLLTRQAAERSDNRRAWDTRGDESRRAFDRVRQEGLARRGAQEQRTAEPARKDNVETFNKAARGRTRSPRRSTGRTRTRRRTEGEGDGE